MDDKQWLEVLRAIGADGGSQNIKGPWVVGQNYLIRTVTMTVTGKLVAVHAQELELTQACWIASTGRFNQALLGRWDDNAQHEPFPSGVIIGRGSVVDAAPLSCAIPVVVR